MFLLVCKNMKNDYSGQNQFQFVKIIDFIYVNNSNLIYFVLFFLNAILTLQQWPYCSQAIIKV